MPAKKTFEEYLYSYQLSRDLWCSYVRERRLNYISKCCQQLLVKRWHRGNRFAITPIMASIQIWCLLLSVSIITKHIVGATCYSPTFYCTFRGWQLCWFTPRNALDLIEWGLTMFSRKYIQSILCNHCKEPVGFRPLTWGNWT